MKIEIGSSACVQAHLKAAQPAANVEIKSIDNGQYTRWTEGQLITTNINYIIF